MMVRKDEAWKMLEEAVQSSRDLSEVSSPPAVLTTVNFSFL